MDILPEVRVDELPAAVLPSRQHILLAMKDGSTCFLTVGQILEILIGAAPATLDTIEEIATALQDNPDFYQALTDMIGLKADRSEVNIPNLTAKATPVDADSFRVWDLAGAAFKKLTFASLKAWVLGLVGAQVVTPWMPYVPTFAGIGSVTDLRCRSRRVGASLEVEAYFITGTVTADIFEMSLGFNGADGGVLIDDYWNGVRPVLGVGVTNIVGLISVYILGIGNSNVVNLSVSNATREGLTPVSGSGLGASTAIGMKFAVPIEGWS